ncbi:XrtA system polysaccharide chain length determinant [Hydrogenophaga sp.]|uniref:XrtA system polysaccharide chain length determinant n=1 Tax=Hydrogenophaga sp. TaxID=1904254 RepID=UPI00286E08DF|nr:XrtA system polysaccharide chain length determinant [Hydrogenophaga sp.]
MQELLQQLNSILRGMWKYRRVGVAVAWVVAAAGAIGVLLMPDRFEASARVYVDTQTILRPLMAGLAVQPNVDQQVTMLSRTLISRPNVEKLIRMADLDLAAKSKPEQDRLIDAVTADLSIKTTGRDNLYTLSYRGANPDRALRVVQSMLTIFVESSLGDSKSDSDSARRFIEEQIKNYEAKLSEAESRLKEFRLRNIDLQAQGGLDMAGRIAEIGSTLNQARLELREAESARDAARRQLEQEKASRKSAARVPAASLATPELDTRLATLKSNLDALMQRFTEAHPDVTNTRRMIRELEDQKKREIADLQKQAEANPQVLVDSDPVLSDLSRVVSQSDVQVASLRARVAEYESRARRAQEQMKLAPQMEAELAQLNRDYEIHKKNYEDLVSRRESVSMSGELDQASSMANFRVIDPPRAENRPVAPNRVLLLPAVLVAALAVGAGVTFLISQIRPVYFEAGSLRAHAQLPLLGVVTLIRNDAVRRRESRSLKRFIASLVVLVLIFVIGMAFLSYMASTGR